MPLGIYQHHQTEHQRLFQYRFASKEQENQQRTIHLSPLNIEAGVASDHDKPPFPLGPLTVRPSIAGTYSSREYSPPRRTVD